MKARLFASALGSAVFGGVVAVAVRPSAAQFGSPFGEAGRIVFEQVQTSRSGYAALVRDTKTGA